MFLETPSCTHPPGRHTPVFGRRGVGEWPLPTSSPLCPFHPGAPFRGSQQQALTNYTQKPTTPPEPFLYTLWPPGPPPHWSVFCLLPSFNRLFMRGALIALPAESFWVFRFLILHDKGAFEQSRQPGTKSLQIPPETLWKEDVPACLFVFCRIHLTIPHLRLHLKAAVLRHAQLEEIECDDSSC